jgi:hypothetical protein
VRVRLESSFEVIDAVLLKIDSLCSAQGRDPVERRRVRACPGHFQVLLPPKEKKAWIYEDSDSNDTGSGVSFFYYNANGHICIDFRNQRMYLGSSVTAPIG